MFQGVIDSLTSGFTTVLNYIPSVIGALLVLLVGYIIARILKAVVTKLLNRLKLDDRLAGGRGGQYVGRLSPKGSPARLVGSVVFWVLMLFVISATIGTLRIPALTSFMNQVFAYLPRVIAALLIFIVAAALAGAIGGLAQRLMGDTVTGRIVRTAGPTLVMAIAVFMILTQLNIAPVIVTATYIALIGALALAGALAFGLGGRATAADMIDSAYRRAREERDTVKQDMRHGREQVRADSGRPYPPAHQQQDAGVTGEEPTTRGSHSVI